MSTSARPRLALTMGDPAGVGPELCLRALADAGVRQACLPILFGDLGVAREVGRRLGLPVPETVIDAEGLDGLGTGAGAAMVELASLPPGSVEPGTVQRACGAAAALESAPVGQLLLEGGSTAAATLARLGLRRLRVAGRPAPGIVRLQAIGAEAPEIITKPGSYGWAGAFG